jgi:glycosyltransferase involved in cell wall biosynthesis
VIDSVLLPNWCSTLSNVLSEETIPMESPKITSERGPKSKRKTVTFLLPGGGRIPMGGFKVVYEYANGLADRGWQVSIVHPHFAGLEAIRTFSALWARRWLGYQICRLSYRPDHWFEIDPRINLLYTKTPDARFMPPADICVATAWLTAPWVAAYPSVGVYLIQHLETWMGGREADVMATWKLPLRKVVISKWLQDVARRLDEAAWYIPNGLNFGVFGVDVAPEKRDPQTTAMLYHRSDWKGSSDGIKALQMARARVPNLRAQVFGVSPCPPDMPRWIEYYQNPPQHKLREIYNRAAIFLSPSWAEGWPLPPAEALQCGAALAATNIGGHREYAVHGQTALLSPAKDPDAMAANIVRLLEDQPLRLRLARQGHLHIQQFTWNRAVTSFESILNEALRSRGRDCSTASECAKHDVLPEVTQGAD